MLLQPITVPFSKSTLKPSVYTLISASYRYWGKCTKGDMSTSFR